jgi:hypothetical protein
MDGLAKVDFSRRIGRSKMSIFSVIEPPTSKDGSPYELGFNKGCRDYGNDIICPFPRDSKEAKEFWNGVSDGRYYR